MANSNSSVLPGLDCVEAHFKGRSDAIPPAIAELLQNSTIGLVTNQTGCTREGVEAFKVLCDGGARVRALFSPEHGLQGTLEGAIESGQTEDGLPVYSLYGQTRRANDEMLQGLQTIVFDIQDVGARFYTYSTTLAYLLEECATRGISVLVLDRPNPIGDNIEGPRLEEVHRSFVGYLRESVTHGMTLGELAKFHCADAELNLDLYIAQVANWKRTMRWPQTNLPWRPPSPNLPDWESAAWYPGECILEWSGVSVGRGTEAPFQIVGAPWLEPDKVLSAMSQWPASIRAEIQGEAIEFTPTRAKWENEACRGLRFRSNSDLNVPHNPVAVGLALLATLHHTHPAHVDEALLQKSLPLLGSSQILDLLRRNEVQEALNVAQREAQEFRTQRAPFLIYES